LAAIEQTALHEGKPAATVASGRREEPEQATFLAALGAVWAVGRPLDWRHVMPHGGRRVGLPSYPWQRERHWADAAVPRAPGSTARTKPRVEDEALGWVHEPRWEPVASSATGGPPSRWLLLGGEEGLAAALRARGHAVEVMPLDGLDASIEAGLVASAPPA